VTKISILCYDLSSNAFGRAYLLARLLQARYEVEIVGPARRGELWMPLSNNAEVECKRIPFAEGSASFKQLKRLMDLIDGDIIYASKPLFTSYLAGLLARKKRPIVLDIDDWEWGFTLERIRNGALFSQVRRWLRSIIFPYRMSGYFGAWISQRLIPRADQVTVSNDFLRARFGGTVVPHGRDENAFVPEAWDQKELKKSYDIDPTKKVVMFFGTPRRYKGVEDLINAVALIPNDRLVLAIVGADGQDQYGSLIARTADEVLGSRFKSFGTCPYERVAEFIALSDIIVIPQRRDVSTQGQMPAKVFDAMAMAKPIVATAVSDLPKVLDGCGWIVEPNSPQALARALTEIMDDENEAKTRGMRARSEFLKRYSWTAIRPGLLSVFSRYEQSGDRKVSRLSPSHSTVRGVRTRRGSYSLT